MKKWTACAFSSTCGRIKQRMSCHSVIHIECAY
jgi:hypothetical protein